MSNSLAFARLAEERKSWRKSELHGFFAKPCKNEDGSTSLLRWKCGIPGKKNTAWEGALYPLDMYFTEDYPNKPPKCQFEETLFHPNIYPSGTVCCSILNETQDWNPSITIKQILICIQDLLANPYNNDPVQREPYELLKSDKNAFWERVRLEAKKWSISIPNPNHDIMISCCPKEGISSIRFCPTADIFAVTSWDDTITCYKYDIDMNLSTKIIATNSHNRSVLCCCWDKCGSYVFSGGCDNYINIWQSNGLFAKIGQHKASVSCMEYANNYNILISGSWDKTIKFWDIRCCNKYNECIKTLNIGSKVYAMSIGGNSLVIGLSNKYVQHYDLRKCRKYISSKKVTDIYNNIKDELRIRDIEIFPDKKGYIVTCIVGTAFAHYFDENKNIKDFRWKCHREPHNIDNNDNQNVYSVNTIRFHREYKSLVTGGDDGNIFIWDIQTKSKLHRHQFKQMRYKNNEFAPITSIDFDRNCNIMAYAISYNWNKGEKYYDDNTQKPQIYLHSIGLEFDPATY